jgi:hypothetical protein
MLSLLILYGCDTWSLTLRGEYKLRGFANTVLRRIFGPKSEEVVRGWRRLHNEELHNLYASPNIIRVIQSRKMRLAVHVACIGQMKNSYNILAAKSKGKRQNISVDLRILKWILGK